MAVILCEKHGKQPCAFASQSVVDAILRNLPPNKWLVFKVDSIDDRTTYHWVDANFFGDVQNIKLDKVVHIGNEEAAWELAMKLVPVCRECYKDYLQQYGLPYPYDVGHSATDPK